MKDERGAGSSEAIVILALVFYFIFMGYLGRSVGYSADIPGLQSGWQIPYLSVGGHWYSVFTGTFDVLVALMNMLGWILSSLVSYMALIGWGFSGNLPSFVTAFLFVPFSFAMGWLVLSLVRGRE